MVNGSKRRATSSRGWVLTAILAIALCVLASLLVRRGVSGSYESGDAWRSLLGICGLGEGLDGAHQTILRLRWFKVAVGIGVGAALALAGALLQGLFRNDLASPAILGMTSGASLGAHIALIAVAGYGPLADSAASMSANPLPVTLASFLGAFSVAVFVTGLAGVGGRISVPTLILLGVAVNATLGGAIAALQNFALRDAELTTAIVFWSFGSIAEPQGIQVVLAFVAVVLPMAVIPFVGLELNLFAAGESDAATLGVHTARVQWMVLVASSLAAGLAVAVAGPIPFVGLVVPHLLRLLGGRDHRRLLGLCLLCGPVLVLMAELFRIEVLSGRMEIGVVLSLVGGPFFLFLLLMNRGRLRAW